MDPADSRQADDADDDGNVRLAAYSTARRGHAAMIERTVRGEASLEKPAAKLAEYRDALAGMAVQIREFEKRIRRHESEKAELVARIEQLDRRNAVLNSQLRDATAAESARLGELQRELETERGASVATRRQLETTEQALLECQQQKAEAAEKYASSSDQMLAEIKAVTIRLDDALGASAKENERLLAIIAERDAAIVRLQETAGRRENEQAGSLRHPVSTPGDDQPGGVVTEAESRAPHNGAAIVALEGGHEVSYALCKPVMLIGRSDKADIRVEGLRASRRHACLRVEEDAVIIEDMGSLNGTVVNGQRIQRCELHDGDVLEIGSAQLRFVSGAAGALTPRADDMSGAQSGTHSTACVA